MNLQDNGNYIGRERIDIENREEATALKITCGHKARKAALLAEKARIISQAIKMLRDSEDRQVAAMKEGTVLIPPLHL